MMSDHSSPKRCRGASIGLRLWTHISHPLPSHRITARDGTLSSCNPVLLKIASPSAFGNSEWDNRPANTYFDRKLSRTESHNPFTMSTPVTRMSRFAYGILQ